MNCNEKCNGECPCSNKKEPITFPIMATWTEMGCDVPVEIVEHMGEYKNKSFYMTRRGFAIPEDQLDFQLFSTTLEAKKVFKKLLTIFKNRSK